MLSSLVNFNSMLSLALLSIQTNNITPSPRGISHHNSVSWKSSFVVSWYLILNHMILHHVMSYHIMLYLIDHVISYRIMLYHIASCYIISHHIISYRIISCYIISCYIISYHAKSIMSCKIITCAILTLPLFFIFLTRWIQPGSALCREVRVAPVHWLTDWLTDWLTALIHICEDFILSKVISLRFIIRPRSEWQAYICLMKL